MAQVTTPKANTMGPPNQNNKSGPEPKFLSTLPSPPILPSLPAPAPAPAPDSASTPIQVPSPPTSTTAPTSRTAPLVPPKPSPPCSFNFYIERPSTITHSATGTITVPGAKVPLIAVDQLPSWIEIVGVPRDLQKSINETGPSIIATKTISITGTTTINNTTGTAASTMNPCTTTNDSLFSLTIGAKSLGIVQRSTKPDTYEVRLGKGYQVGLINNTNNTVKERMITNILISPRDRERIRAASASANITTTAVTHAESSGTRQPPPIGLFERLPPPPTPKVAENPYAHIRVRKVSPSSRECYFDANGNIVHRRSRSSSGRRRSGRRGCGSRRKREGKSKEKEMEREWEGDEKRDRRHPAERLREAFDDDIVPPAELRIKGLAREVPGTGGGGDMREIKESQENRTKLLSEDGIEYCRHWCHHGTCKYRAQCKYKHEMPNTLGKLRAIGLAAFPTWWLAAQQLAAQQVKQYAAATAASHSAANNIGGRSGSKTRRSGRSRRSARRMAALHSPEMPGSRRKERELTGFIGGSSLLGKKDYALSPSPPVAEDHDTNRGSEHAESSSFESDYSSGVASCSTCDGHSSDLSLSSDSSSSSNENVPIRGSRHAGRKASMVSREKKSSVKSQAAAPITSISQGKKKVEILARDDYNAPTYFSDAKPNTTTPLQRIIHHHTQDRNQDRDRYYQLREQEPTPSTPRNLLLRRQSDTLESEIAAAVAATDARSRMLAEKGYSTRADRNERKENSKSHILTSSHSVIDGLGYRIPHSVVSTDNQKKGKETERLIDV